MDDWNNRFLLGWPTFRGYVKGGYRIWTFVVGSSFRLKMNQNGPRIEAHQVCETNRGWHGGPKKRTFYPKNPKPTSKLASYWSKKQPPLLKNRFKLTLPLEAPLIILKVNSCSPCIYPQEWHITCKLMVGRRSVPFEMVPFQETFVSFQGCISPSNHPAVVAPWRWKVEDS